MILSEGTIGKVYLVKEIRAAGPTAGRLEALGVKEQTRIRIQNSRRGGAVIIRVRGTRLALGQGIAGCVRIEEVGGHERNNGDRGAGR